MVFVCRVTEIKQRDTNYEYMERIRFRINEICMLIPTDSVILVKIICADIQKDTFNDYYRMDNENETPKI